MAEELQGTSFESLLNQLQNSNDSYVRAWAAGRLGETANDNEQVLEALRIVAQSDTKTSVRDAAKKALRKLGGKVDEAVEQPATVQAVGVGWLVFVVPILLGFILSPNLAIFLVYFYWPVLLVGVIGAGGGAIIGNVWKKSRAAISIGAILGAILGLVVGWEIEFIIINALGLNFD